MAGYVDLSAATATSVPSTAAQTAGTTFNFNSPYASGGTQAPSATNNAPNVATSSLGGPASSILGGTAGVAGLLSNPLVLIAIGGGAVFLAVFLMRKKLT
jgi:hypothetical protein